MTDERSEITDRELPVPEDPGFDGTTLDDINTDPMFVNFGPTHPATHGTFRIYAKLDGETVEKAGVDIGYLHRGFEKMVETKQYNQVIPFTEENFGKLLHYLA